MRRLDWPERLAACVEAARNQPFVWGSHDCVLWACDVIREMIGSDPASSFRGTYDSAAGALRTVLEIGEDFRTAVETVCTAQGFKVTAPAFAQRGDLVLVPSGREGWPEALGICVGKDAMTAGETGLVKISMAQAIMAWRVA